MVWIPPSPRGVRGKKWGLKLKPLADLTATMCQGGDNKNFSQTDGGAEMNATTYGLDNAKRVFQLYWVEYESSEIRNNKLGR